MGAVVAFHLCVVVGFEGWISGLGLLPSSSSNDGRFGESEPLHVRLNGPKKIVVFPGICVRGMTCVFFCIALVARKLIQLHIGQVGNICGNTCLLDFRLVYGCFEMLARMLPSELYCSSLIDRFLGSMPV